MATTRPGGRTARNTAAVLDATTALLAEGGLDALTIAAVAEHAGVHPSSVYRRWGTVPRLVLAAALARAGADLPPPDEGSLAADLRALAHGIRSFLATPVGAALLRLAAGLDDPDALREEYWATRRGDFATILERAATRGELRSTADHALALELLIAPIHQRVLFTSAPLDDAFLDTLIEHVLHGIGAER